MVEPGLSLSRAKVVNCAVFWLATLVPCKSISAFVAISTLTLLYYGCRSFPPQGCKVLPNDVAEHKIILELTDDGYDLLSLYSVVTIFPIGSDASYDFETIPLLKKSSSWESCVGWPSSCKQEWFMDLTGSARAPRFPRVSAFFGCHTISWVY